LFAAPLTFAAAPRTYTNPILFSDYSDPDVIRVGSDYYMTASSFHFSPGLPVLKSQDLVHWTIIAHAATRRIRQQRRVTRMLIGEDKTARFEG
jgi:beta-xylosidase